MINVYCFHIAWNTAEWYQTNGQQGMAFWPGIQRLLAAWRFWFLSYKPPQCLKCSNNLLSFWLVGVVRLTVKVGWAITGLHLWCWSDLIISPKLFINEETWKMKWGYFCHSIFIVVEYLINGIWKTFILWNIKIFLYSFENVEEVLLLYKKKSPIY